MQKEDKLLNGKGGEQFVLKSGCSKLNLNAYFYNDRNSNCGFETYMTGIHMGEVVLGCRLQGGNCPEDSQPHSGKGTGRGRICCYLITFVSSYCCIPIYGTFVPNVAP